LKVVGKLSSVCEEEPSPGPEAEATGPDQLSKACLLELLDSPDICPPYPGFRESWEGHKARLKGGVEKPDANLRVLALDLLKILNIFALQGFMEPEGVNAKQKGIDLALLIQGEGEEALWSELVSSACRKFMPNMQQCAEGRFSDQEQRDQLLPPVNPNHREQGILIDDVLFVCVGTHRQGAKGSSFRLTWAVDCPEGLKQKGMVGYTMIEDTQLANPVASKIQKDVFPSTENMKSGDWHLKSILAKILVKRILSFPAKRLEQEGKIMDKIALHRALFGELKMTAVRGASDSIQKWEGFLLALTQSLDLEGLKVLISIAPGEVNDLQKRGQIIVNQGRFNEVDSSQMTAGNCVVVVVPGYERKADRRRFGTMEVAIGQK
jgi:hypothetical protein